MGISPQQKAAFENDGVTLLGQVLNAAELAETRRRFDKLFQERLGTTDKGLRDLYAANPGADKPATATQRHYQFLNIWEHDDWFKELLHKKELLDVVEAVIGPNIQLLHDQVFYKPPGDGAPSLWHQDNSYWNFTPPNLASSGLHWMMWIRKTPACIFYPAASATACSSRNH